MRLKGKTALITGSGRSLGKACALRLAQEGANIVVNSRGTPEEAEAAAAEVRSLGVDSIAIVADVTDPEQVEGMRRQVADRYGAVDILVNNVGVSPYVPMLEMEPDDWHQIMDINLHSLFYVTRAFLKPMVDKGWGRIVNIAGHVAFMQRTRGVHTAASTAGKISFTRALATEVAPYGVTVNYICPGSMATPPRTKYYRDQKASGVPPWMASPDMDADRFLRETVPMGRAGTPEELANVVAFLASDDSSYMTGQGFLVNGGMFYL